MSVGRVLGSIAAGTAAGTLIGIAIFYVTVSVVDEDWHVPW